MESSLRQVEFKKNTLKESSIPSRSPEVVRALQRVKTSESEKAHRESVANQVKEASDNLKKAKKAKAFNDSSFQEIARLQIYQEELGDILKKIEAINLELKSLNPGGLLSAVYELANKQKLQSLRDEKQRLISEHGDNHTFGDVEKIQAAITNTGCNIQDIVEMRNLNYRLLAIHNELPNKILDDYYSEKQFQFEVATGEMQKTEAKKYQSSIDIKLIDLLQSNDLLNRDKSIEYFSNDDFEKNQNFVDQIKLENSIYLTRVLGNLPDILDEDKSYIRSKFEELCANPDPDNPARAELSYKILKNIPSVHLRQTQPIVGDDGKIYLQPLSLALNRGGKECERTSLHFAVRPVISHERGDWESTKYMIVTNLGDIINSQQNKGEFVSINSMDQQFVVSPESKGLGLPQGTKIVVKGGVDNEFIEAAKLHGIEVIQTDASEKPFVEIYKETIGNISEHGDDRWGWSFEIGKLLLAITNISFASHSGSNSDKFDNFLTQYPTLESFKLYNSSLEESDNIVSKLSPVQRQWLLHKWKGKSI